MAFPIRCELVPYHLPWSAIKHRPEHKHGIEDEACYYCSPCTIPHDPVQLSSWSEQAKILQQDCHLNEEAKRTVYDFGGIHPLCMSAVACGRACLVYYIELIEQLSEGDLPLMYAVWRQIFRHQCDQQYEPCSPFNHVPSHYNLNHD
jgi:hypothetical protein